MGGSRITLMVITLGAPSAQKATSNMDESYYTSQTTTTSPEAAAALGIFYLLLFVFYAIPVLIAGWILYKKAGKPGWSAIVPYYNTIVMADIAKLGIGWAVAAILVPFVGVYVFIKWAQQYDRGVGFWLLFIFLPIIAVFFANKANYTGGALAGQFGPVPAGQAGPQAYQQPVQPTYAQPQQPAVPQGYNQPQQPAPQAQGQNNTPGGYPQA